jgi:hypothetical protein
MTGTAGYSRTERAVLITVAAVTGVGLNGAFLYGMFRVPGSLRDALSNPISLAFIAEALLMTCVLAWLLGRWGVSRRPWGWFVALSLLGGMAFALPVVLLWGPREER